ncbi:MAG: KGK domain-containing protein [Snowella sp.]|nr:KGK domain-containing protein [Snowella sp.]
MEKREFLNSGDVISMEASKKILVNHTTFTVGELLQFMVKNWIGGELGKQWFVEGAECKILSPKKGWRNGKIKVSLEFISDEAESPLDEIRREMQQDIES